MARCQSCDSPAGLGEPDAQFNLGNMYSDGEGVPQDYVQAYKWWNIAGAGGDADALKNLKDLAEKMTNEHIAEAQRLSTAFKPTKTP